ncbi:peptidoglycan-binding domain-containing protein [Methylobacterium gossipiicola]|uniref:Putative peptidoglycan binding domain-containing protein n=1 Tax=Methylobacterium gossipiicola TaxID=582675 RepID=A0A1I2QF69_9HYPH|nr:peptidoglycan-binding domain-containing protein [Methylobacterium gossipiicola]SFG27052.1 Putative peptidoglycan binding domain-containing protein [Methylobacterium gossipiicola]
MRDQREIIVPPQPRGPRADAATRRQRAAADEHPRGWLADLGAIGGWAGRLLMNRPGDVAGFVVVVGAAAFISLNALGYQAGRHPAPIFPKLPPRQTAEKPSPRRVEAPKVEAAKTDPIKTDAAKTEIARVEVPKPEAAKADTPRIALIQPTPRPISRDTLGEIARAGETTSSVTPKSDPAVAKAQRALVKLGYGPLKADGILGTGTRAAIERFERDRKLPVKGEPTGRTLRELAARAANAPG